MRYDLKAPVFAGRRNGGGNHAIVNAEACPAFQTNRMMMMPAALKLKTGNALVLQVDLRNKTGGS